MSEPELERTLVAPPLRSDRVALHPVRTPAQHQLILEMLTEEGNAFRFRGVGPGISGPSLNRVMSENVLAQFAITEREEDGMVGFVQCITPDFTHGTAQVAVALSSNYQLRGWPLEAVVLFFNYLFRAYPLRVLYLETPDFNLALIRRGLERLFSHDGTLPEHEWHLGDYWDVHFFSMSRDSFYALPVVRRVLDQAHGFSSDH